MATHTIALEPYPINAPAETVWTVLTDLKHYPDWNPFTPRIESSLEIGEPVTLHVKRGDSLSKMSFALEVFDPPHEIAWRLPKILHKAIFSAYRTQKVVPVDAESCTYQTSDTFDGWLARTLYNKQNEWVLKNFNRLAAALKERSEAQFADERRP